MRITVKTNETNLNIPLPNALVFNRLGIRLLLLYLKNINVDIEIPTSAVISCYSATKKSMRIYKKYHPSWTLVEVNTSDGENIKIKV